MGPKKKSLEDLEELSILDSQKEDTEYVSDDELEVKKVVEKKQKIYNVKPKDPNAPKKERSPAQIAAWSKALEKRQSNRNSRAVVKESVAERIKREIQEKELAAKTSIEKKIVSKAISIKKKQIKKEAMLDDVSDDDTDIESVKKQVRKQPSRAVKESENKISYQFI